LLELLMRRSDAIVSKSVLLDEVWGPDFEGDPNIVEVYIGYVRKKIDAPFGVQTILTVRGAGYRLVADPTTETPDDGPT
jgi:two-component system OmpR family response regulator